MCQTCHAGKQRWQREPGAGRSRRSQEWIRLHALPSPPRHQEELQGLGTPVRSSSSACNLPLVPKAGVLIKAEKPQATGILQARTAAPTQPTAGATLGAPGLNSNPPSASSWETQLLGHRRVCTRASAGTGVHEAGKVSPGSSAFLSLQGARSPRVRQVREGWPAC